MLISKKFIIPDKCPENCPHRGSFAKYGQSATCGRCPILCCTSDEDGFCLVDPEDYREDWAEEWLDFFKDMKVDQPKLRFHIAGKE